MERSGVERVERRRCRVERWSGEKWSGEKWSGEKAQSNVHTYTYVLLVCTVGTQS